MTFWVAWSGGLDSTYALWSLVEAGEEVRANHVDLRYRHYRFGAAAEDDGRVLAERAAVQAMGGWFAARGQPVDVTSSRLDWGVARVLIPEVEMILPHIINAALAGGAMRGDSVVIGSNAGDWGGASIESIEWGWGEMADALCRYGPTPRILLHGRHVTRAEQIGRMPPDLVDLTISCRRPRRGSDGTWQPCGSRRPFDSGVRGRLYPCSCAALVDLLPRYRGGWAADE